MDPPSVALLWWLLVVTAIVYIIYRTTKSAPIVIVSILIIYIMIASSMNSDKEYLLERTRNIKPPFETFASTYGTKPLASTYEEANSPMRCGPCAESGLNDPNSIASSPYASPIFHNEGNFVGSCCGMKPPSIGTPRTCVESYSHSGRESYTQTGCGSCSECESVRNVRPAYVKRLMNCADSYLADGTADTLVPYAV